jgi:transcriptional regulator with XRE-family HTH domain
LTAAIGLRNCRQMVTMSPNPKHRKRSIGRNVRHVRIALGLTQIEFAEWIGVSNTRVSHWERGHNVPSPSHMEKIAQLSGVSVGWLMDEHEGIR